MNEFLNVLLNRSTQTHKVNVRSLRVNKDHTMCRMTTEKKSLSDIFLKMSVQEDKITCTPLQSNGVLL